MITAEHFSKVNKLAFKSFLWSLVTLSSLMLSAQVSTDSLILYLPFNGDVNDYSGNENHATAFNVLADTNRFGAENSSYKFDGSTSYIEIPASPSMNMIQQADEFSITAWININQWHSSGNVFSIFERYNPNTDSGWLLEANWAGGGIIFLSDETSTLNWAGCNFSWNFDQWYHLGFTYSQTTQLANFYIDGELICSTPYSSPINLMDETAPFIIGRSLAGPDEYSDGLIDEYRIYYRELSAVEIDTFFELGKDEITLRNDYDLFPNPVNDQLVIRATSHMQRTEYSILDVTGKKFTSGILSNSVNTIDLSALPGGIYFLNINDGFSTSKKIIKL